MRFRELIDAILGNQRPPVDSDTQVILDQAEGRIAGRLSKLTGQRRDEVLAESYRRADKLLAGKRR